MKTIIAAAALILSGCATSQMIAAGPSGKPMHFIKCGSAVLEACYAKAAEVCPNGYNFVDRQNSQNGAVFASQPGMAWHVMGPQSMAVECK